MIIPVGVNRYMHIVLFGIMSLTASIVCPQSLNEGHFVLHLSLYEFSISLIMVPMHVARNCIHFHSHYVSKAMV